MPPLKRFTVLIVLLPLLCGACAPFNFAGRLWRSVFEPDPVDESVARGDPAWNNIGGLDIGQTGTVPGGETARIEAGWLSALGQPCKRILLVDTRGTELVCHGEAGWYAMRDVPTGFDALLLR